MGGPGSGPRPRQAAPEPESNPQKRYYVLTLEAFEAYCEDVVRIRYKDPSYLPKDKREAYRGCTSGPFWLKPPQRELARYIIERLAAGEPVRILILKSRQVGFTTLVAALITWYQRIWPGSGAMVLAQSNPDVNKIADETYGHIFEKSDPVFFEKPAPIPKVNGWKYPNGSRMYVESAKLKGTAHGVGSGSMNHILHLTEVSKWRSAKETLNSLNPSFAKTGPTIYIMESSPNGTGGHGAEFYRRWKEATSPNRQFDDGTKAWFVAFYDDPTYMRYPPKDWREMFHRIIDLKENDREVPTELLRQSGVTPEEIEWFRYGVKPTDDRPVVKLAIEQIWWRRWMIETEYDGDEVSFRQEYPMDDMSCFLASGNHVFRGLTRTSLAKMHDEAEAEEKKHPALKYHVEIRGENAWIDTEVMGGWLTVWEEPKEGEGYFIAADVALGGKCLSALFVLKVSDGSQVAEWSGSVEAADFADYLNRTGRLFNNAEISVERNLGAGVINLLERVYAYPNLYMTTTGSPNSGRDGLDPVRNAFYTSATSKPRLIANFTHLVRAGMVKTKSLTFLSQALSWVQDDNGLPSAPGPEDRDDVLMSGLIAYTCAFEAFINGLIEYTVAPAKRVDERYKTVDMVLDEDDKARRAFADSMRLTFHVDPDDDAMMDAYGDGYVE